MILENAIRFQEPNGMYLDKSLSFGTKIPTAHGHILYLASMYYLFTQDRALLTDLFPSIVKLSIIFAGRFLLINMVCCHRLIPMTMK